MSQSNVAIARRWFEEIWNGREIGKIHEFLTEVSVCHSEDGILKGTKDFIEKVYQPFVKAFPDLQVEIVNTIAEKDQVVVVWEVTATHTGDAFGNAPTGRQLRSHGMTWMRIVDGKMMEGRDCWNLDRFLKKLA